MGGILHFPLTTLSRAAAREKKALEASLRALSQTVFSCSEDARIAWEEIFGKARYHASECVVSEETGHVRSGVPKKDAKPEIQGDRISGSFEPDPEGIDRELHRKGFFVIASNHLDDKVLSAPEMIALYKSQGTSIDRGSASTKIRCSLRTRSS